MRFSDSKTSWFNRNKIGVNTSLYLRRYRSLEKNWFSCSRNNFSYSYEVESVLSKHEQRCCRYWPVQLMLIKVCFAPALLRSPFSFALSLLTHVVLYVNNPQRVEFYIWTQFSVVISQVCNNKNNTSLNSRKYFSVCILLTFWHTCMRSRR